MEIVVEWTAMLLGAIPVAVFAVLRKRGSGHTWLATGLTFGAIVCPWSTALYGLYFSHPLGLTPGLIGFLSTLIHDELPYQAAIGLGVLAPNTVVPPEAERMLILLGGAIWASIYAIIGAIADQLIRETAMSGRGDR